MCALNSTSNVTDTATGDSKTTIVHIMVHTAVAYMYNVCARNLQLVATFSRLSIFHQRDKLQPTIGSGNICDTAELRLVRLHGAVYFTTGVLPFQGILGLCGFLGPFPARR